MTRAARARTEPATGDAMTTGDAPRRRENAFTLIRRLVSGGVTLAISHSDWRKVRRTSRALLARWPSAVAISTLRCELEAASRPIRSSGGIRSRRAAAASSAYLSRPATPRRRYSTASELQHSDDGRPTPRFGLK